MKLTKKSLITAILVLLLSCSLAGGVAYAVINFTIMFNDVVLAGTDYFTVDGGVYYKNFTLSAGTGSQSLTINRIDLDNNVELTAYDLVVYSSGASFSLGGADTSSYDVEVASATGFGGASKCTVIKGITYGGGASQSVSLSYSGAESSEQIYVIVLTNQGKNRYIKDMYDLKMSNNETLHNVDFDALEPADRRAYYKNVYIIDSFTVDEEFTLNYPSYINLLYSTLTLAAPLTVSHHDYGMFEMEAITGKIDNTNAMFTIYSPNAYYSESSCIGGLVVTTTENFSKTSDQIDFSSNTEGLTRLLTDALNYAASTVPAQILSDCALPVKYHRYGVSYSYELLQSETAENGESAQTVPNALRTADTKTLYLKITATYNDTSDTLTVPLNIIGTSSKAFVDGLAEAIKLHNVRTAAMAPAIDENGNIIKDVNNETVFVPKLRNSLDLASVSLHFAESFGYTDDFTLTIADAINLDFEYDMHRYRRVDFRYIADEYKVKFGAASDWATAKVLADISFYVNPQTMLLVVDTEYITVTDGTNSANSDFIIDGVSLETQRQYLEQYVETVFISEVTDVINILHVDTEENGIYRGPTIEVIPYTFGFVDIDYKVFVLTEEDLTSVLSGTLTEGEIAAILAASSNISSSFVFGPVGDTVEAGTMQPRAELVLQLEEGYKLLLSMEFMYDENDETYGSLGNYTTYREVIVPSSGIGGNDYTEYISGNTFAPYFSSLVGGRLINSVAGIPYDDGGAYEFSPGIGMVKLKMSIVNEDVADFCTVVEFDEYWQIDIDIDHIPSRNTLIEVEALFYLDTEADVISTQRYSFIIPGIYRQGVGKDFESAALYNLVMNIKSNDKYIYESYEGLLLVDGAKAVADVLDASLASFRAYGIIGTTDSLNLDLRGVELLTGTKKMIFDNCTLVGTSSNDDALKPFGDFTSYELVDLSLKNCGITQVQFEKGYLYVLNNLVKLNLDDNAISKLAVTLPDGTITELLLYRTITELSVNNNIIEELDGVASLPKLSVLHINNNMVKSFEPLSDLGELSKVHLASNTATDFAHSDGLTYYGTFGEINVPLYCKLIDRGVEIYYGTGLLVEIGDGKLISQEQYEAALILNAIYIFKTQFNTINMPNSTTEWTNIGGGTPLPGLTHYFVAHYILVDYVSAGAFTHTGDEIACAGLSSGDAFKLIISVTPTGSTTTVYKEFSLVYMTASF